MPKPEDVLKTEDTINVNAKGEYSDWSGRLEQLAPDDDAKVREFAKVAGLPYETVLAEFLGYANPASAQDAALPDGAGKWAVKHVVQFRVHNRIARAWIQLKAAHPAEHAEYVKAVTAGWAKNADEARKTPWTDRPGWTDEPKLPIKERQRNLPNGKSVTEPAEFGYVWYNRLITDHCYRPFRTGSYEPRVAVPTEHGLEIYDPSDPEFIDRIGYQLCSLQGDPVPTRDLSVAAKALTSRALSRALPSERVTDLWLRVAPYGDFGARIDMRDAYQRCIVVGPDGWKIEAIGDPTFDARSHMLPLPEPAVHPGGDWTRVNRLWEFVRLPEPRPPEDLRLLALADLVQLILAPGTPKPVKVIGGEEGIGKSTMSGFYQAVVDPSRTPLVALPEKEEEFVNLAINRAIINLDNVSYVGPDVSDHLARLCTGIGLVKRKLYSDSEEVATNVRRSVILNGITAAPKAPDLLRRVLFFLLELPPNQLGSSVLEAQWRKDHPGILGGLLDLAVLTSRVLRDTPPPNYSSGMADYVRIGQAVAIAMGRRPLEFQFAWETNVDRQNEAATDDPWVSLLYDFFATRPPEAKAVRAEEIARYANIERKGMLSREITSQHVGSAIARSAKTLRKMQIHVGRRTMHGHLEYFREVPPDKIPETAPPAPPAPPKALPLDGSEWVGLPASSPTRDPPAPPATPVTYSDSSSRVGLGGQPHPSPTHSPTPHSAAVNHPLGGAGDPSSRRIGVEGEESAESRAQEPRATDGDERDEGLVEESLVDCDALERRKRAALKDPPART